MSRPSQRYARQLALPEIGEGGQRRLGRSSVLLVGLGGLGCPAAQYLATVGVGRLILCDHDRVDASNLARQILYRESDLERPKVEAARDALKLLRPDLVVDCHSRRMDSRALLELLGGVDLLIDGSDNYATRLAVNAACLEAGKPWIMAAAIRFEGQLSVFRPDRAPSPCYRCAYEDAAGTLEDCHGAGVYAPLTGIIGVAAASEGLRVLLNIHDEAPALQLFDARNFLWHRLALGARPACPACGDARA